VDGLRAAVSAAIDYGLAGIDSSERNPPPVPPVLLVQARVAARSGVELDTVLRRYLAGYALIGNFMVEEAEEGAQGPTLRRLFRLQAGLFDRLLAAVSEEHRRGGERRLDSGEARRFEVVQRLLNGELADTGELAYDFGGLNMGLVAQGGEVEDALRAVAAALDCRLLLIRPDEQVAWVWLGRQDEHDGANLQSQIQSTLSPETRLAIGEPGRGIAGWRLTHRQALAALPIATRGSEQVVRYADVALLASSLRDELLATSLRNIYLEPLESGIGNGDSVLKTLKAFLASGRSVTSAAAVLGINRDTVTSRLRTAEEAIGRPLDSWAAELEAVFALEKLGSPGA
jgi:PucR C-terminal helix-turn-helix domain/GGDEF-like domain